MVKSKRSNPHRGSLFSDWLKEEGIYEQVVAQAEKEKKEIPIIRLMKWSRRLLDAKRAVPVSNEASKRAANIAKRVFRAESEFPLFEFL